MIASSVQCRQHAGGALAARLPCTYPAWCRHMCCLSSSQAVHSAAVGFRAGPIPDPLGVLSQWHAEASLACQVAYVEDGLEAIIFTADGDMRQGLNNLQATHSGFKLVNRENVFKVGSCSCAAHPACHPLHHPPCIGPIPSAAPAPTSLCG